MGVARVEWYPAPRRQRRDWVGFWPLLLPAVVLVAFAAWALLSPSKPKTLTPAPGYEGSLVWGNGIFARAPEMQAWLRQHGGRYPLWAHKHPKGVKLITVRHRAHPARHSKKKPAAH